MSLSWCRLQDTHTFAVVFDDYSPGGLHHVDGLTGIV